MLFVGCQKDLADIWTADVEEYQSLNDKVYIDNDNFACWSQGDKVSVAIDNNAIYEATIRINNSTHSATIEGVPVVQSNNTIKAIFPYSVDNMFTPTGFSLKLPQMQRYETTTNPNGGSYQSVNAPMLAIGEKEGNTYRLGFKNAGSLLKVTVPYNLVDKIESNGANPIEGDMYISAIEVSSTNGRPLWGNVTYSDIDYVSNQNLANGESNSPLSTVLFQFSEGKGIVKSTQSSRDFYIAIPPVEGCTFKVKVFYEIGGTIYSFTSAESAPNTIARNVIVDMNLSGVLGTTEVVDDRGNGTEASPFLIGDIEDFKMVNRYINENPDTYYYCKQTADIEFLIGSTETCLGGERGFMGSYDGNGFIKVLRDAKITNVHFNGYFTRGYVMNPNVTYGALCNRVAEGANITISNCTASGNMSNSTFYGLDGNDCLGLGSMIGTIDSSATVKITDVYVYLNNKNECDAYGIVGSINLSNAESSATVNLSIEQCITEGNLSFVNQNQSRYMGVGSCIGTIVSGTNGVVNVSVNKCINKQSMSVGGEYYSPEGVGGIIGRVDVSTQNSSLSITNCVNRALNMSGHNVMGGIIGYIKFAGSECSISNSYSYGKIIGPTSVYDNRLCGGIIGWAESGDIHLNHVYANAPGMMSSNFKWIIGKNTGANLILDAYVYAPGDNQTNGCSGAKRMMRARELVYRLNQNRNQTEEPIWEEWMVRGGTAMLVIE